MPMGELHPQDKCAKCGLVGEWPELERVVLFTTRAIAPVCVDKASCVRRRQEKAA
jgi:hypothetical protein